MAEEKKRFPWRLVACAALLVPLAAVVGFIETVGRQGTIVGRYEQIKEGMSSAEALQVLRDYPIVLDSDRTWRFIVWEEAWTDGVFFLTITFERDQVRDKYFSEMHPLLIGPAPARAWHVWWHVRRWAEQAYTAIHGPRR